jgi:adenosylcobinamide kinase/adenosylcobinamide-phosphate guanylyltransferase
VNGQCDVILVDCLTLWLSNLLHLELREKDLSKRLNAFIRTLKSLTTPVVLISNEVGLGVVPANPLARKFCDLAGMLHQKIAHIAHQVYFVTSGISKQLK